MTDALVAVSVWQPVHIQPGCLIGEILKFLAKGDRNTRVRCGGALFSVKDGIGTTDSFVFDTDDTRIEGSGTIDLKEEMLDLGLKPHPKDVSIFVMRGPLHITGPLSDPHFSAQKKGLFRRAGLAVLLGMVNPFAALIPLIETGTGKDADCAAVLGAVPGAAREAQRPVRSGHVKGIDKD